MDAKTRADAIAHAIASYPKESCGLVIIVKGRKKYIACANNVTDATSHFRIEPEEYAAAEDRGEIVAIVHSHPDAHQRPSQADKVSCENSGLPWYIFAIHKNDEGQIALFGEAQLEPNGYEAPLVGREFSYGVLDCYTIVRDWYKRERGIELDDYPREDNWWHTGGDWYMDHYREQGFEPVTDGSLEVGDVFLMQVRAEKTNHAGVYLGNGVFLHHLHGRLSSRDVYGGYWKDVTRLHVRRKD